MPIAKLTSLVAFELRAGEEDYSKPSKKTHEDTNIYTFNNERRASLYSKNVPS